MNRYYLPPGTWSDTRLVLSGDEAHHCSRVMREREGNEIELFDGEGRSARCIINCISRGAVTCIVSEQNVQKTHAHPITLCQAIPKGGNMELIVQKAVELGVSTIQPLITAHTVARPDALRKKQEKWQRIALEACKQCGQNHLPEVRKPLEFSGWLTSRTPATTSLIAALDSNAVHLQTLFTTSPPANDIALLVGPEGDFSPREYAAAYDAGFQPVSFGNIILRVETATLYGLSILQHEISALLLKNKG